MSDLTLKHQINNTTEDDGRGITVDVYCGLKVRSASISGAAVFGEQLLLTLNYDFNFGIRRMSS
jgi:hypothetical protein